MRYQLSAHRASDVFIKGYLRLTDIVVIPGLADGASQQCQVLVGKAILSDPGLFQVIVSALRVRCDRLRVRAEPPTAHLGRGRAALTGQEKGIIRILVAQEAWLTTVGEVVHPFRGFEGSFLGCLLNAHVLHSGADQVEIGRAHV